jgi:hypothetical protein
LLGGLSLSQPALFNVETKVTHEIRAHLERGGFILFKAKINKEIAAGLGCFPFFWATFKQLDAFPSYPAKSSATTLRTSIVPIARRSVVPSDANRLPVYE